MQDIYLQVKKSMTESSERLKKLGQVYKPEWRYESRQEDSGDVDDESKTKSTKIKGEKILDVLKSEWSMKNITAPYIVENCVPRFNFVQCGDEELPTDEKDLIKLCSRSGYGDLKTTTTLVDEKVRNAYEIMGKNLKLTPDAINYLDLIKKPISKMLYNGKGIDLKINKLNVYPAGGMFKEHVDTPREGVIGTLIVELPYHYEGGEFVIRFNDLTQDYHKIKGRRSYDESLRLFAFYCECPHQIYSVTKGCRVTVTFYIVEQPSLTIAATPKISTIPTISVKSKKRSREEDEKDDDEDTEDDKDDEDDDKDKEDEDDEECEIDWKYHSRKWNVVDKSVEGWKEEKDGGFVEILDKIVELNMKVKTPVGFFLSNQYSNSQYLAGNFRGRDDAFIKKLKSDARFSKLKMSILPVLIHHAERIDESGEDPESDKWSMNVYRWTEADILGVESTSALQDDIVSDDVKFIGDNWKVLNEHVESGCEYTGNESRDSVVDNHYFTIAVILGQ